MPKWLKIGLGIIAGLLLILLVALFIFNIMKSSGAYKIALQAVQSNQEIIAVLGTPIDDGMFLMGSINVSGDSGYADISFPISGPNGSGRVFVVAVKQYGKWEMKDLAVRIEAGDQLIQLIQSEE